ncbi:hypothetical protein KPH14_007559 [Odynerus spinipes]|uniref:H15 domain-containing protein n=1 Tax=Odynerus spinipes TaxID=1348599 RepID=A0AAD9RIH6_9HYME|nr:hypothetical protein KPH14_007559 [Odynerus spinipes]
MGKSGPKMSSMITSAIRQLRQAQGSTSKEIMNYITSRFDSLEPAMQRQMSAALKRGLDYGILKKCRGHYKLNSMAEGGPMERPARRRTKNRRSSAKKKKRNTRAGQKRKGRGSTRSKTGACGGRCRCLSTRGRNAYALEEDIPREQLKQQPRKDVVCCYENKWKEQGDNGTDSSDQSRSTLGSAGEINNPENS